MFKFIKIVINHTKERKDGEKKTYMHGVLGPYLGLVNHGSVKLEQSREVIFIIRNWIMDEECLNGIYLYMPYTGKECVKGKICEKTKRNLWKGKESHVYTLL